MFRILLIIFVFLTSCSNEKKMFFKVLNPEFTNIFFSNLLTESDSLNILEYEYFYNGAGVALHDINNDGFVDIFFTGNQVDNKLFLNNGDLTFTDITEKSNLSKPNKLIWSSGVNIIDINSDGMVDIYISNTLRKNKKLRENLLYINQGLDNNSLPVFKEMSKEYNLNDNSYSSNSSFFDYDNDGDLDLYIGVSQIQDMNPNIYRDLSKDKNPVSVDKLYENVWDDSLNHPVFIEVTNNSGINIQGQTNSVIINDFNLDGWLDIYVGNDFLSNDILYINNKDKSFTDKSRDVFKHFSLSSMGTDISDINNDGKLDVFVSEMQPYYNKRKKLFNRQANYRREQITEKYNYSNQYLRNVLQLNLGIKRETGLPIFSEVGMFSGVSETDWSWSTLFADFDNDGWNDLFISNGFPKDILDKDFSDFRTGQGKYYTNRLLLNYIPEIKVRNFVFKNEKNVKFSDVSDDWGLNFPTHSHGAAYGDLDNDGDLDLVINNVNDFSTILENTSNQNEEKNNFTRIKLLDSEDYSSVIGSSIILFYNGKMQKQLYTNQRGYLSQSESILHFGLGKNEKIDSIHVKWIGGNTESFYNIELNQTNIIKKNTSIKHRFYKNNSNLFINYSNASKIIHEDYDKDFDDFDFQPTIPKKFSQNGPSLSVSDLNNDGLEDLFISANSTQEEVIFFQNSKGEFKKEKVSFKSDNDLLEEDAGVFIFDFENDGDNDVYIARGSTQYPEKSNFYKDVLFINDGTGNFFDNSSIVPVQNSNSTCVKGADFDNDGDIDLFVGGGPIPFKYPYSDSSYLLENLSSNHELKFKNSNSKINPNKPLGIVNDALWTDFNNDNLIDLIVVCEWDNIRFFKNNGFLLEEINDSGIQKYSGWWNSITSSDVDNDGDLDYLVGNFGTNTLFKSDFQKPISIFGNDLDNNGTVETIISFFANDSIGNKRNYIYHVWEDLVKLYPEIRKYFNSHRKYGMAESSEVLSKFNDFNSINLSSNYLKSSLVENLGNNKFKMYPLPDECQYSPIYGIKKVNLNEDEYDDFILVGNNLGVEPNQARIDAINGIVLKNNGNRKFSVVKFDDSNLYIPGNARGAVSLKYGNEYLNIFSQNNDSIKVYKFADKKNSKIIDWKNKEFKCKIQMISGNEKILYRIDNQSYNSQSSNSIEVTNKVKKIQFFSRSDLLLREFINN